MTRTETILWMFDEMDCGAAVLDDLGSVLALNACAQRILAKHATPAGIDKRHGCDWAGKTLRRLFGKDLARSSRDIVVAGARQSTELRPLVGHKMPLNGCAMPDGGVILVVVDLDEWPRPRIGVLRQAFGLTHAEARLAAQLAQGRSLRTIAAERRVSITTARAQLRSVLGKTHTHRQAELVALVNRFAPLV